MTFAREKLQIKCEARHDLPAALQGPKGQELLAVRSRESQLSETTYEGKDRDYFAHTNANY